MSIYEPVNLMFTRNQCQPLPATAKPNAVWHPLREATPGSLPAERCTLNTINVFTIKKRRGILKLARLVRRRRINKNKQKKRLWGHIIRP